MRARPMLPKSDSTLPRAYQYHELASVYDRVMRHVPYRMWVRYIHQILETLQFAPKSVLDVACGTGAVTIALAKMGYEVVGVDVSPEMIEQARAKVCSRELAIEFHVQDAAAMKLGRKFDMALSLFDSLNYLTDPASLTMACRRVAEHLHRPGVFIFDLNTEYAFLHNLFDQDNVGTDENPIYVWKSRYDRGAKLCTVAMEFRFRVANEVRVFRETHVQRAYSDAEIREMLSAAGFGEVIAYHAYSFLPPGPTTDRIYCVALLSS